MSPAKYFFQQLSLWRPQGKLARLGTQLVAVGTRTNRYLGYLFIFYAPPCCSREGDTLEMVSFRGEEQAVMLLCWLLISDQGTD